MVVQQSPQTTRSKMEALFVASSTLRRNRRYFDIEKLNGLELQSHVQRRKPYSSTKNIEQKINHSFSNSTAAFTERRQRDIDKFKSRFHSEDRPYSSQKPRQTSLSTRSAKTVKGVGLDKNLSREQFYKVRSKPVLDERLFNNFFLEEPDTTHTADLGRGPQRDFDNSLKHINDIQYQTQKLYEEVYYKRTTLDCRFHYKTQKQTERSFFNPVRPENKPATDLSPKAVKKSQKFARKKSGPIDSFYMNSGRELPCQLQARTGTNLTSHWRNNESNITRPQMEYSVRCMKQKLQSERKQKIAKSKKPQFKRNQICDKKYFIINPNA